MVTYFLLQLVRPISPLRIQCHMVIEITSHKKHSHVQSVIRCIVVNMIWSYIDHIVMGEFNIQTCWRCSADESYSAFKLLPVVNCAQFYYPRLTAMSSILLLIVAFAISNILFTQLCNYTSVICKEAVC